MRRNTFFRIALVTLLAFCLAGQAFAGGGGEKKEELPVLRVAIIPWQLSLPAVYMSEQGWDVENGFKVETSTYPMGAPLLEAMGANLWDIAACGPAAVFSVANTGLKIIADISVASGGVCAYIRPDHPAAKLKGQVPGYPEVYGNAATLKGSKVLAPVGSMNHYNVLQWVSIFGLGPDDLEVVHMDNAASFQAFKVGEGDITAFSPPLSYNAEAEGWIGGGELHKLNIRLMDCLYANPRLYDQKKELIAKFVKQMYRANDFFEANKEKTVQLLNDFTAKNGLPTSIENTRRDLSTRPFLTSQEAKGRIPGESMKGIAEFYASVGTLEKEKLARFNSETMVKEIVDMALK